MGTFVWSKNRGGRHCVDSPCPTMMAQGLGDDSIGHWFVANFPEVSNMPKMTRAADKPPYRVPLMSEVVEMPWNGFTVASTFSGCGGSCTGYRMAGFKVGWANEFVPAAQDSYRANMAVGSYLDPRDVKLVQPEEVLAALGIKAGELDLLDSSPPCQAFSSAGKRHKGWGEDKKYEGGGSQKNETMFSHFFRLLRGLRPKVFIAENVSGLVKGTCKGMFLEILAEMKAAGYRVSCKVLDAQWLGVPQQRQRAIFVGVREDLVDKDTGEPLMSCHPSPLPYRYSVREAIPWIGESFTQTVVDGDVLKKTNGVSPMVRANRVHLHVEPESDMTGLATGAEHDRMGGPGTQSDKYFQLVKPPLDGVSPTVTAAGGNAGLASVCHPIERRKFSIAELRRICAFPDDFVLTGSYAQQWERLGNSVPPLMMRAIAEVIRDKVLNRIAKSPTKPRPANRPIPRRRP